MIDLDELERLAKAATPRPWTAGWIEMKTFGQPVVSCDGTILFESKNYYWKSRKHLAASDSNAAYIVAACNAVPGLVARIRELEREKVILASHLSKYVMHTMSTKEWLEWAERTAKESGE